MPTPERTSLAAIVDAGRDILETAGPAGLTMHCLLYTSDAADE